MRAICSLSQQQRRRIIRRGVEMTSCSWFHIYIDVCVRARMRGLLGMGGVEDCEHCCQLAVFAALLEK